MKKMIFAMTIATGLLAANFANAQKNLGSVFATQGRLNEAISCFEQALALDPDDADVYNNLGTAFKNQGQTDAAIACYQRALVLNPDHSEANRNLLHWIAFRK